MARKRLFKHHSRHGFTLVEMLVIAPVVILAIGAFLTVIISMTGEVLASRASNTMAYNIQDALNRIEQDVKQSAGFLAKNNVDLSTNGAQGYNNDAPAFDQPDGTTTNFTNAGGVSGTALILNMVATTGNPVSAGSGFVYLTNQPNACDSTLLKNNTALGYNVVYFVKADPTNNNVSTLWRRTIMPATYDDGVGVVCNAPWQRPSCAPGYSNAYCKTNDVKLVEGVAASDFVVNYYSTAGDTAPNTTAANGGTAVSNRNAALAATPTVEVAITARQNVAGQDIDRAASLRASRLDTNASAIATLPSASIPTAPTVTASIAAPTTRTFNVTNATHTNTVEARVAGVNSAGTGTNGTTTATVPLWAPFNFVNTWTDIGTADAVYAPSGYTKTSSGLVVLQGLVKRSGNSTSQEIIATLPVGYRPPGTARYLYQSIANNTNARIDIYPNGEIHLDTAGKTDVMLNGISFMPTGTTFTNVAPPYSNGWTLYADSNYGIIPSIANVGSDRTEVRAMVSSGTMTDPTTMYTIPAGNRPGQYMLLPGQGNGAFNSFGVRADGTVVARGTGNSWYSNHGVYVNAGRASGTTCTTQWCTLTLMNGWVHYDAVNFSTAEYTKTADGMVYLKGMIRSGTTTAWTNLGQLPVDYRPRDGISFPVMSYNAIGRIQIDKDGYVKIVYGSNTWISLDGISFMPGQ